MIGDKLSQCVDLDRYYSGGYDIQKDVVDFRRRVEAEGLAHAVTIYDGPHPRCVFDSKIEVYYSVEVFLGEPGDLDSEESEVFTVGLDMRTPVGGMGPVRVWIGPNPDFWVTTDSFLKPMWVNSRPDDYLRYQVAHHKMTRLLDIMQDIPPFKPLVDMEFDFGIEGE